MIRRQVGHGPVEMIDASPGNPTGIAYPDRDLTNSALPVGSSLTTPHGIRFTTLRTGRHARVEIAFHQRTGVPGAPAVNAVQTGAGYRIHWTSPPDHGQIVLGYRVTSWPSGPTTFVRGPAGYRTSLALPLVKTGSTPPTFTVQALNQDGWSAAGPAMTPSASGPNVTLTVAVLQVDGLAQLRGERGERSGRAQRRAVGRWPGPRSARSPARPSTEPGPTPCSATTSAVCSRAPSC